MKVETIDLEQFVVIEYNPKSNGRQDFASLEVATRAAKAEAKDNPGKHYLVAQVLEAFKAKQPVETVEV